MTSPFVDFKNAALVFNVPDGSYTVNSAGNRVANSRALKIEALLKLSKDKGDLTKYSKDVEAYAGADGYAFLLEGYLVEPLTYPSEINFLMEGDAEITLTIGQPKIGRFKLLPLIDSPYLIGAGVEIVTAIKGIFRVN
ncbi:MAG: hypothetical protein KME29_04690 [Calothrix sp. FI2-JRJ7]|jgi:hypothetical protein|nr:hypothetical protein [Calothrix sp. FI2-JRJ7]